jgi:two-component system, OmpR family, alkaline phosphatase synthesis response regulator PhoP
MRPKILVVDDEEDILHLVEYTLGRNGFQVTCVMTGEDAIKTARAQQPDALVLDLMLPGSDGLEVCRVLKNDPKTKGTPILMLSAKGEESDVVAGLEMGADDYVAKPFSPKVLVARLKAVLRRKAAPAADEAGALKIQNLVIHPGRHEVLVDGKVAELTFTEFKILHLLARRPGWVFTRSQIVDGVQGQDVAVTDRSVDVHIVSLRRKLGEYGAHIETVRGVGYRFKDV